MSIIDDAVVEEEEMFQVRLRDSNAAIEGGTATVVIADNDGAVTETTPEDDTTPEDGDDTDVVETTPEDDTPLVVEAVLDTLVLTDAALDTLALTPEFVPDSLSYTAEVEKGGIVGDHAGCGRPRSSGSRWSCRRMPTRKPKTIRSYSTEQQHPSTSS